MCNEMNVFFLPYFMYCSKNIAREKEWVAIFPTYSDCLPIVMSSHEILFMSMYLRRSLSMKIIQEYIWMHIVSRQKCFKMYTCIMIQMRPEVYNIFPFDVITISHNLFKNINQSISYIYNLSRYIYLYISYKQFLYLCVTKILSRRESRLYFLFCTC